LKAARGQVVSVGNRSDPDRAQRATTRIVATPRGPARIWVHEGRGAPAPEALATLVLGHGAGGGIDSPDLRRLSGELPKRGIRVVLVEQPWRLSGRRVADRPEILDQCWRAVVADLQARGDITGALVCGGRSAGARVALRTAGSCGAAAVLALAFPLHPPGRADRSRIAELAEVSSGIPVLVLQGDRDPFGGPSEVLAELPAAVVRRPVPPLAGSGVSVVPVPWSDHSLRVGRSAPLTSGESWEAVEGVIAWWLRAISAAHRTAA